MVHSHGNSMFVGIKIGEKLRDLLDASNNAFSQYVKENIPENLQIMQIDQDEYIGKVIKSGITLEGLNNIFMNVKTMLKLACPKYSFTDDAIKFIALTPIPSRVIY